MLIAGGGPAGCAAALSLRASAPELSVCVIESSRYAGIRIGETLAPVARRILRHLEVWEEFESLKPREVLGSVAAWGSSVLHENDFIYSAHGAGWHLDRVRFDAMLAGSAEARGAVLLRDTRMEHIAYNNDAWHVTLSENSSIAARFLIDATGRSAAVARRQGARVKQTDRLVGFAQFFSESTHSDPRTIVETFADGWWYTAGLPDRRRVVICMTDADIGRQLGLKKYATWRQLLDETSHVRKYVNEARPVGLPLVRASESRCVEVPSASTWLAVGDAASIFDPLSSLGIVKAMRSGIFASYAIADFLLSGDQRGLARYRRFVHDDYVGYLRIRKRFYDEERRWPDSEFWGRRRGTLIHA